MGDGASLPWFESDPYSLLRAKGDEGRQCDRLVLCQLKVKSLDHPDDRHLHFQHGKVAADAQAGTTAEWHIGKRVVDKKRVFGWPHA